MSTKSTLNSSLMPLQGATTIITNYNRQGGLDYDSSFMNSEGLAGAVSITQAKTYEEVANERGENLSLASARVYNISVIMNSYNSRFHDMIAGNIVEIGSVTASIPKTEEFIVVLDSVTSKYQRTLVETPVQVDGVLRFVVSDVFGNKFTKAETAETLTEGQFHVDTTTKVITFSELDNNKQVNVMYLKKAALDSYTSKSDPLLTTKYFMLEFISKLQGEGDSIPVTSYAKIRKVTVDGDLPDITKQKSPNAPITYNFKTAPIPEGESPMEVIFENGTDPNA